MTKSKMKVMKFKVLVEKDEDGFYVADVPELQGCHTQAKNQKELMKRVKEVIELCLEDNNPVVRKVDIKEIEFPVQSSKLILA
ncbi:MAG: type II toxin-antitoxin system HicB family antitoxin [Nanoarchaeota archaeon]